MARTRKRARQATAPVGDKEDAVGDVPVREEHVEQSQEEDDAFESPKRKRKTPSKKQDRNAKDVEAAAELSLFDIMKNHSGAVDLAAKEWVRLYQQDRAAATAKLLTLLVQECGVVGVEVSGRQVEEGEADVLVQQLCRKATQVGLTDPFAGKGGMRVRDAALSLWEALVREAYGVGVLFDDYMLDKLINLLIALSCSVVRPFRYVGVMVSTQGVISWTRVMSVLAEGREAAQRQLAAEEKKHPSKAVKERIMSFRRTLQRLHQQINYLRDMTQKVFQAISSHRFRDIADEVRCLVIAGVGSWVAALPSEFLSDQYLKYLAWALSDRAAVVRATSIDALLTIYRQPDNISPLHDFTQRFASRYGELIYDVDEGCAVKALQLLAVLVNTGELSWRSVRGTYTLLCDESRGIRLAAAQLVAQILPELGRNHLHQMAAPTPSKATPGGRALRVGPAAGPSDDVCWSEAEVSLAGLVHMMAMMAADEDEPAEGALTQRRLCDIYAAGGVPLDDGAVDEMVDALFDSVPVLHQWQTLIDVLAGDGSRVTGGVPLLTTSALQLLRAALQRAVQGPGPGAKGRAAKEAAAAASAARQQVTLLLSKALPKLLRRFQGDASQIVPLLGLVPCLQLEVYSIRGEAKAFEALLRQAGELLGKHAGMAVIDVAARALAGAAAAAPDALKDRAQLVVGSVADSLARKLAAAVASLQGMPADDLADALAAVAAGEPADDTLFTARVALLRVYRLMLHYGPAVARLSAVSQALGSVMEDLASGSDYGRSMAQLALLASWNRLLWLRQALADGDDEGVAEVARERSALLRQAVAIMDATPHEAVCDACYAVVADLLLLLGGREGEAGADGGGGGGVPPLDEEEAAAAVHKLWTAADRVLHSEPAGEAGDEAEAEAAEGAKVQAVAALGRLALTGALPPRCSWLGPALVSRWVAHGPGVEEQVKELTREYKARRGAAKLGDLYVAALARVFDAAALGGEGGEEAEDAAALATRIAATFAAANPAVGQVLRVCKGLVSCAARGGGAGRPELLTAVLPFVGRLSGAHAGALAAHLEAAFAGAAPAPEGAGGAWEPYWSLAAALRVRVERQGKAGQGRGGGGGGGGARGRRVSFAPDAAAPGGRGKAVLAPTRVQPRRKRGAQDVSEAPAAAEDSDGEEAEPVEDADAAEQEAEGEQGWGGDDAGNAFGSGAAGSGGGGGSQWQQPIGSLEALPTRAGLPHTALAAAVDESESDDEDGDAGAESGRESGDEDGAGGLLTEEQLPDGGYGQKEASSEEEVEEEEEEDDGIEPPRRPRRRRRF